MGRNDVFNALFDTIRDSLDWAYEVENKEYASFIDGALRVSGNLLDRLNKENQSKEE